MPASDETQEAGYCDRCGQPAGRSGHDRCSAARQLEPPRYCRRCRRRLIVQVTPAGWSARCSQHGVLRGGSEAGEGSGDEPEAP